jgi:peptidoglycan/LPS O-acetylase OafA/YrhL
MNNRIEFLDFLKGFSMLSIVLYHYAQRDVHGLWASFVMLGGAGVHLFFIASGFGLAYSKQTYTLTAFYKRRFINLLIPYYLVVLLIYGVNQLLPMYTNAGLYELSGHIFLFKMFDETLDTSFNYPFWFMSTIIQFYLVFPFLQKLLTVIRYKYFLGITFALSCFYWFLIVWLGLDELRIYNSFFLQYLWEFCLVMVVATEYKNFPSGAFRYSPWLILVFALFNIGLMGTLAKFGGNIGRTVNDVPAAFGYLASCYFVFLLVENKRKYVKEFFLLIGAISYELYLTHFFVFDLIRNFIITYYQPSSWLPYKLFIILPIALGVAKLYAVFNKKYVFPLLARVVSVVPKFAF